MEVLENQLIRKRELVSYAQSTSTKVQLSLILRRMRRQCELAVATLLTAEQATNCLYCL